MAKPNVFDRAPMSIQANVVSDVEAMVGHACGKSISRSGAIKLARKLATGKRELGAVYRVSDAKLCSLVSTGGFAGLGRTRRR